MNSKKLFNVGIIGYGVVGKAVASGFKDVANIKYYDKVGVTDSFEEVVNNSQFIFLCVPTPVKENGSIDLLIMDEVVGNIAKTTNGKDKYIIIKSTVIPGTAQKYKKLYPLLHIVSNPEFLTDRTANYDFINPSRIVLGGDTNDCNVVDELYYSVESMKDCPHFLVSNLEAEICKYTANCFYSTKLSFFNEIYQVCQKMGINYRKVVEMTLASGWVSSMHTKVPGHDGKVGWGGSCFPKDTQAFYTLAKELGVDMKTLKGAIDSNLAIRELTHAEVAGIKDPIDK
jgi:UDPglucose 6-dehydrogenase